MAVLCDCCTYNRVPLNCISQRRSCSHVQGRDNEGIVKTLIIADGTRVQSGTCTRVQSVIYLTICGGGGGGGLRDVSDLLGQHSGVACIDIVIVLLLCLLLTFGCCYDLAVTDGGFEPVVCHHWSGDELMTECSYMKPSAATHFTT